MAVLPLSFLSTRLTNAVGLITTKLLLFSTKAKRASRTSESPEHLKEWHWPNFHPIRSCSRFWAIHGDQASEASGTETPVGESESCQDFSSKVASMQPPCLVLHKQVLLSDAADCGQGGQDQGKEGFQFHPPDRIELDLERIAAGDSMALHINPSPTPMFDTFGRKPLESLTALSPPPLHLSGKTRSEVIFLPRDTPGSCPVHGCQACAVCDTENPAIFNL